MTVETEDLVVLLRLLETWFPLAQELNQRYGWGDGAAELEQLIIHAAPALQLCSNVDEAHLVLFMARGGLSFALHSAADDGGLSEPED